MMPKIVGDYYHNTTFLTPKSMFPGLVTPPDYIQTATGPTATFTRLLTVFSIKKKFIESNFDKLLAIPFLSRISEDFTNYFWHIYQFFLPSFGGIRGGFFLFSAYSSNTWKYLSFEVFE